MRIVVFDLGASHLDVSVIEIAQVGRPCKGSSIF